MWKKSRKEQRNFNRQLSRLYDYGLSKGLTPELLAPIYDRELAVKTLTEHMNEIIAILAPLAARRLGVSLEELKSHLPTVHLEFNPAVNAEIEYDRKTPIIHLYFGLRRFIDNFGDTYASGTVIYDEKNRLTLELKSPFDKVLSIVESLMDQFWDGSIVSQDRIQIWHLGEEQLSFSTSMKLQAERFILGHELAQLLIYMAPESPTELEQGRAFISCLLEHINPERVCLSDSIIDDWSVELACDLIGLDLAIATLDTRKKSSSTISSAVWFLSLVEMLEAYCQIKLTKKLLRDTHPPGSWRLTFLLSKLSSLEPLQELKVTFKVLKLTSEIMAAMGLSDEPADPFEAVIRQINDTGDPRLVEHFYWVRNRKGVRAWQDGDFSTALKCIDRVLEQEPSHALNNLFKAEILFEMREYQAALQCVERALKKDARISRGWEAKGNILSRMLKLEEAISCYDRALDIDPNCPRIRWEKEYIENLL